MQIEIEEVIKKKYIIQIDDTWPDNSSKDIVEARKHLVDAIEMVGLKSINKKEEQTLETLLLIDGVEI